MKEILLENGQKIKFKFLFIFNFIVAFIGYGMFIKPHFSLDSYSEIYDKIHQVHLINGRPLTCLVFKLYTAFGINTVEYQSFFTFFLILITAISITILSSSFFRSIKELSFKKLVLVQISLLVCFINVFYLEWFLYPEMTSIFALGVLCSIIAVYYITKEFKAFNVFISFIFVNFSLSLYQADLGIFIILSMTLLIINNSYKIDKNLFKKGITVLLIGFISSVVNMLIHSYIKHLGVPVNRNANLNIDHILNNLWEILNQQKAIFVDTYGFLPKYIVIIMISILLVIFLILLSKKVITISNIICIMLLAVIGYSITFAPHLIAQSVWLAQRTFVPLFMLFGCLFLILADIINRDNLMKFVSLILGVFLLINMVQIQNIGQNHYSSNKLDRNFALLINNEINKYEMENKVEVKNIAMQFDQSPTYVYQGIEYSKFDTNMRVFVLEWGRVNIINYYSNRNFNSIPMDKDIYDKYFLNKNWDLFDASEQMVFQGDTLYMVIY